MILPLMGGGGLPVAQAVTYVKIVNRQVMRVARALGESPKFQNLSFNGHCFVLSVHVPEGATAAITPAVHGDLRDEIPVTRIRQ